VTNPFFLVYAILLASLLNTIRRPLPQTSQVFGPITVLSGAEISPYRPFTHYTGAAYCPPDKILSWNCGPACDASPSFTPIAAGGDGSSVQYWYVGYDSNLQKVIVAHQGTNPKNLLAVLTDVKVETISLNTSFFPGFPLAIRVHDGFHTQQLITAADVFFAVEKAIAQSGYKNVTVIGHSLGAALALLDSLYLPIFIPDVHYDVITYGLPRVGNQIFADYVDGNANLTRITNKKDPVPTVPGRQEGFVHPQGERHIHDDGTWFYCPGQDNPDQGCIVAEVPNVNDGNVTDHDGPYDGVLIGCLVAATNETSS